MLPHSRWRTGTSQHDLAIDHQLHCGSLFAKNHHHHLVHPRLQDFDFILQPAKMLNQSHLLLWTHSNKPDLMRDV